MSSFEEELALARVRVAQEDQEKRNKIQAAEERALFIKIAFDSLVQEHLPRMMRDVKPYAMVHEPIEGKLPQQIESYPKVWIIRTNKIGVLEDGTLVTPVIPRLFTSDSPYYFEDSGYQGAAIVRGNFEYPLVVTSLDYELYGWAILNGEIWYGITGKGNATKLITWIAEAIARG